MCFAVYMASDLKRNEIPWDPFNPAFFVTSLEAGVHQVRFHFNKQNVYYIGSDQGCSCGYIQSGDICACDEIQLSSKRRNHVQLEDYINNCLDDEESVEIFACWSGDEGCQINSKREIFSSALGMKDFVFLEREYIVIKKCRTSR